MLTTEQMLSKAKAVRKNAYSPYSTCCVGVCIRTTDDQYFTGCNVENASYGLTQCAEANAVGNMISAGAKEIAEVVISSDQPKGFPPCGACRQVLREFAKPDVDIHFTCQDDILKTYTLSALLPDAFTEDYLGGE